MCVLSFRFLPCYKGSVYLLCACVCEGVCTCEALYTVREHIHPVPLSVFPGSLVLQVVYESDICVSAWI